MASVRKRDPKDPNSPWVCEYTDAVGKRHRITPKTGLKKDADAARRRIEAEIERGEHVAVSEDRTVGQLCEEYLRHIEDRWRDGRVGRGRHEVLRISCTNSVSPAARAPASREAHAGYDRAVLSRHDANERTETPNSQEPRRHRSPA